MCASAVRDCFTEVIGSCACLLDKVYLIEPLLIHVGCIRLWIQSCVQQQLAMSTFIDNPLQQH